jgi:ribonuclease J
LTVVEYEDDIIVVDAGMQFATDETPGVDYLLPNTTYLEERKDKVRALVVTHGHLDHIGAIPYLIERLGNPPVYTREFGAMLIKKRHDEYPHLPALNLKVVGADDGAIVIGKNLKVRFFGLTHSIPDSSGIMIETPFGDLIFTGDVRVENHDGIPDEKEIAQYNVLKNRNILLLAMDSTGIEKPGWSLPESTVIENVDRLVANAPGRVLIATFASQVERIIAFIEIAQKYNRKVAIDGRSMKANVEIVKKLKLSDVRHAIPMEEINDYPPNKVLMLATGAQGEEFASLMRMANGTHKQVKLARTDTIILSSSVIPGNERAITTLKDNLFRHDARIITYHDSDVHTSGHGKRGELEWIHRQVKYTYFMPIHGHHFMLKMHAELSRSLGCPQDHIVVPDNGTIVEISDSGRKIKTLAVKAPSSPLTVDGFSIGDIQDVVIRDRQMLAEEGMFVIVASVNASTGKLRKSPDIISRGFVYLRESQDLLREVREVIKKSIEDAAAGQHPIDFDYVKSVVTDQVSKFLLNRTAKRPIVIPVILGF